MNETGKHLAQFVANTWSIWVDAAPWFAFGLVMAGLLKAWFPQSRFRGWLAGRGFFPVLKAAVLGTPLPLCSCSVLPAAIQLRRSGVSKGTTVSFLIATPENGADSIALSYVLLGPWMAIVRPLAAIVSAVVAGMLTDWTSFGQAATASDLSLRETKSPCREGECCGSSVGAPKDEVRMTASFLVGMRYAVTDLLDDIAGWLFLGVVLAGAIDTFVPAGMLTQWGSGILPMLGILAVSIPMYICATASTPVAASMLAAGVSPGTVLVFLLAGPATNLGSMAIVRRELGLRAATAYLFGIGGTAVAFGLLLDAALANPGVSEHSSTQASLEVVPKWLAVSAAALLIPVAIRPVRRMIARAIGTIRNG